MTFVRSVFYNFVLKLSITPKEKSSSACKLRQLVNEFGENIFSADNKILFCKVCEVKVAIVKRFSAVQLRNTKHHFNDCKKVRKENICNNISDIFKPLQGRYSDSIKTEG